MQRKVTEVLMKNLGADKTNEYLRRAGFMAGMEFAKNTLDLNADLNTFTVNMQKALGKMKIGILRMEVFDSDTGDIILSIGEDSSCEKPSAADENMCVYDAGFVAGVLEAYTGKMYDVREVNCCAGAEKRSCSFKGTVSG